LQVINDTAEPLVTTANNTVKTVNKRIKKSFFRSKKRVIRYGLVTVNIALLIGVTSFVVYTRSDSNGGSTSLASAKSADDYHSDPLDTLSSADIAVHIAQLAHLDEVTAVANNADTVNSQLAIVPADSQVVAKPQIVATELKSINDLQTYEAVEGDTVASVAEKFGITKETIRWSNDLTGDTVAVGTKLSIPPVDGFLYKVKSGDTSAKIAEKYGSDEAKIIAFNDAEITGLVEGQEIIIPGGRVPVARSIPNYSGFRFGASAVYGYNGYDYGYCTWYAANRRAEMGRPIPANLGNASTWKVLAQRAGIPVGNTPEVGAVIWTPPRDYYGHVGIVEEKFEDGSVRISEMNTRGWGVRSEKVLTPAQAAAYGYIY
jgi:surface antigen